jgi:hypothetical protein
MGRAVVGTLLASLLSVSLAEAALTVQHDGVGCVLAENHPRLEARITPEAEVARARVFFRAAGTPHWYSIEMTRQAGSWTGVLPKPRASTERIEYYLEATDKVFVPARTAERIAAVVQGPAACQKDVVMAASTPAARVVVTAAAGAPAVPAGFLNAGLLVAGGGGVSAGLIAGVIGGGAALGGGAVVAAGGGKDDRPEEPPPTVPTLPPTVAGVWSGVGADGMERDMADNQNLPTCHRSDDLFLELQEAGSMVTGNARYVSRGGTTCNLEPFGTVRAFTVTGTRNGTAVSLRLFLMLPDGPSIHDLTGTLAGSRLTGTVTSSFPAGGGRGVWAVSRP